jgi:2-iminobutanoate/2-iminopropanoate deaminase
MKMSLAKRAHYAPAVEAGGFVFVSGQLALDSHGVIVGCDIGEQTRLSLENLAAVLGSHDLARQDVVKVTIWLRDARDFPGFNEAYADFFGPHRPARSTVVSELVIPDALIELEAVARAPGA